MLEKYYYFLEIDWWDWRDKGRPLRYRRGEGPKETVPVNGYVSSHTVL